MFKPGDLVKLNTDFFIKTNSSTSIAIYDDTSWLSQHLVPFDDIKNSIGEVIERKFGAWVVWWPKFNGYNVLNDEQLVYANA
jgi:hypothetical protein